MPNGLAGYTALMAHFSMLGTDADKAEENVEQTLLGVIGYSAQTLRLHPNMTPHVLKHMRFEYLRVKGH